MQALIVVGQSLFVAVLLLALVTVTGPAASGQPATTVAACATPAGTPGATQAATLGASPEASPVATPQAGGPIVDADGLAAALRACGLTVEPAGAVEQPFLRPASGEVLTLSGGDLAQPADVQVFAYEDEALAAADAAAIGPDGNPKTMMIHWIAPPHFFRSGSVIVLYLGEDPAVIDLLTAVLGPPFAGA
jgi:hypothetical protein